ncbi:MAG: OmpA family protein [Gammaproteobacteria bacterium]|nr:OmpA family protein [Gammaproteobacteria bacterium]
MKTRIGKLTVGVLLATGLALPMQASAWWGGPGDYYGPGGYGSNWGPFDGFGDAMGDMDFNMSFRGNTHNRMRGYGNGYSRPYYGFGYPYAPVPAAYTPPVARPVVSPVTAVVAPADGDADGVADASDLCPQSAANAQVDAFGCEVDAAIVLRGVNFLTDSDQLTAQSLAILDGVAATLTANPDIRVQVAGHTDSQGEAVYNKDLSQRRSASVVDYLVGKGVASDNLQPAGFGEEQPVADNGSAEGRAENRRVELVRQQG